MCVKFDAYLRHLARQHLRRDMRQLEPLLLLQLRRRLLHDQGDQLGEDLALAKAAGKDTGKKRVGFLKGKRGMA